jgi:hypothetical protein
MNKLVLSAFLGLSFILAGCSQPPANADNQQKMQQEQLSAQGNMVAGMPAIQNFFEKKLLKTIIEMRDDPKLSTYTYVTDLNGKLHLRCNSIGYGIPYATQYTNPSKTEWGYWQYYGGHVSSNVIPQADPNGLFSPASAEGTFVLCKNPKGTDIKPVYFEDRVTVSPFELLND